MRAKLAELLRNGQMNENFEIELLCPSTMCGKCKRIIENLEQIFNEINEQLNLQIVTELDEMLKYRSWILPSLFINKKLIYAGYVPPIKYLRDRILKEFFERQN